METTWDLSVFYKGFDDPALEADLTKLASMAAEGEAILKQDKSCRAGPAGGDCTSGSVPQYADAC